MLAAELSQPPCAHRSQAQAYDPLVIGVGAAFHEARRGCAIDQSHCAVMAQEESVGNRADRWSERLVEAADRQQQLVLGGREAECGRLVFTPSGETTEGGSEREELSVLGIIEVVGGTRSHKVYRITICSGRTEPDGWKS